MIIEKRSGISFAFQIFRQMTAEKIKIKSRRIANKLLRVGKLKPKNCFLCGESITNMHHIDYDYPDKVIWLCKYHKNKIYLKNII